MQNLPITATPPATSAQAPANPTENSAAQAAEPFGSVLARQHTNVSEPDTGKRDSGRPAPPPADSAAATTIRDKKLVELQAPPPDGVSTLPGDMLAALLPTTASANNTVANEKTGLLKPAPDNEKASLLVAPTPDGVGTLPSDVMATLTPVPKTLAPTPKMPQDAGVATTMQTKPIAAGMLGGGQQPVGSQMAPSLFRAQGSAMSAAAAGVANTSTTQGDAFSAALETSGKDTASTARLNIGTAQTSMQTAQSDAATLASLTQIGTAPTGTSQNAPAQAIINTPVTHDAWGGEFNQKITWLATQHEQSAELHLNQPHLGPLDVVLKVSGDQATAMFTSPHAAVRDAVEQALPKLREMLADNGIMLGNATVNDQSSKEQPKGDGGLFGRVGGVTSPGGSIQTGGSAAPIRRHHGMVDTFA